MDRLLAGIEQIFLYLDDFLFASPDQGTYLLHMLFVLERLCDVGLLLIWHKCQFGQEKTDFLGHPVIAASIQPLAFHVKAIRDLGVRHHIVSEIPRDNQLLHEVHSRYFQDFFASHRIF